MRTDGKSCQDFPRRGPGWSGGTTTNTPIAAMVAASDPSSTRVQLEIKKNPNAADRPFVT